MEYNKALVIIDVQVAMFTYKVPIYRGEEVLQNLEALLEKAREIKLPIIYIQHTQSDPEGEFSEGAPGWQIHPRIAPKDGEIVIQKTIWDAFSGTSLDDVLKKQNIDTLYITGMQSDYCVDTTCRSAMSKGYKNILISDAQSTFDTPILTAKQIIEHHLYVLSGIAQIQSTQEVLESNFGQE